MTAHRQVSAADRRSRYGSGQSRGFTLAEVLVALALLALLATMSWRGVSGMADAKQSADARVNETLRLGTVLAQWEQDLQQVHDTPLAPALAFDGKTLRVVRRQADGLQVVAWALQEARWTRWASPVAISAQGLQDAWLTSQQLLGNEAGQLTLYEGLGSWQIYFYRNNAWTNAQSSGDVNPGTAGGPASFALPSGVRLVLAMGQQTEGQGGSTVTRDLLVPPQPARQAP
jgi:general secretion pathway protein J